MTDINTELLDGLGDSNLISAIGSLYDLGDDATPLLADHLEDMHAIQDRVTALLDATKTLYEAYKNSQAELQAQKDANVKLMYDATKRGLKTDNQQQAEADKANEEFDEKLANIDLTGDDE